MLAQGREDRDKKIEESSAVLDEADDLVRQSHGTKEIVRLARTASSCTLEEAVRRRRQCMDDSDIGGISEVRRSASRQGLGDAVIIGEGAELADLWEGVGE